MKQNSKTQKKRTLNSMTRRCVDKMMERISKIFNDNSKKNLFEENEQTYVNFLAKQFGGFKANSDEGYYSKVFDSLIDYASGNQKIFSQTKHLCYELAGHVSKVGDTIHKIVAAFETYTTSQSATYKKIDFQINEEVNIVNKKLISGLSEWGSQMLIQKKFIIDNMAGFFHYKKHEYNEMAKLLSLQADVQNKYKKKAQVLEQAKVKLFESKNVEKWKLASNNVKTDITQILNKFEIARDVMLPEVD